MTAAGTARRSFSRLAYVAANKVAITPPMTKLAGSFVSIFAEALTWSSDPSRRIREAMATMMPEANDAKTNGQIKISTPGIFSRRRVSRMPTIRAAIAKVEATAMSVVAGLAIPSLSIISITLACAGSCDSIEAASSIQNSCPSPRRSINRPRAIKNAVPPTSVATVEPINAVPGSKTNFACAVIASARPMPCSAAIASSIAPLRSFPFP